MSYFKSLLLVGVAFGIGYHMRSAQSPPIATMETAGHHEISQPATVQSLRKSFSAKQNPVSKIESAAEAPAPETFAQMVANCRNTELNWIQTHLYSRTKSNSMSEEERAADPGQNSVAGQRELSKYWYGQGSFQAGADTFRIEIFIKLAGDATDADGKVSHECTDYQGFIFRNERLASISGGGCNGYPERVDSDAPVELLTTYTNAELSPYISALMIPMPASPPYTSDLEFLPAEQDDWQATSDFSWSATTAQAEGETLSQYYEQENAQYDDDDRKAGREPASRLTLTTDQGD